MKIKRTRFCRLLLAMSTSWPILCIVAAISSPVNASIVTLTYSFTATGFTSLPSSGSAIPQDPITGSVTLTFDPTKFTAPSTVDAISLTILGHTYTLAEVSFEEALIGKPQVFGSVNGLNNIMPGTNDFLLNLYLQPDGTVAGGGQFVYTVSSNIANQFAAGFGSGSVPVALVPASIPEPPALALLGLGLFGVALARRRSH